MILHRLSILNYRNIREADLSFSDKLNCFIGLNGQGKTNLLDAIYLLSFTKSAFTATDSLNITHGEEMSLVKGDYLTSHCEAVSQRSDLTSHSASGLTGEAGPLSISCGLKRGVKKTFRRGKKDYKRLIDHIGLIPLVMVCPQDNQLIEEGSDERRRFMDSVISQQDKTYLEHLTTYNALLKQRNALLRQLSNSDTALTSHSEAVPQRSGLTAEGGPTSSRDSGLLDVFDLQMLAPAQYIYNARTTFIESFVPVFQELYAAVSGGKEQVQLRYVSQLQTRDLAEAFRNTRQRDLMLGWTSQGVHKDELEMLISDGGETYPLKRVASQGQQKTYLLAMKLAQSLYLTSHSAAFSQRSGLTSHSAAVSHPILLLDDIFDKLDSERVERIVQLVRSDRFGQIFITDTDRQHLTSIVQPDASAKIFYVSNGTISQ